MLNIVAKNNYTVTSRANADMQRNWISLVTVTGNEVFAIGGGVPDNDTFKILNSVSYYDIAKNIWEGGFPKLIQARCNASACTLKGIVYVFCGWDEYSRKTNSIESISENYLFSKSTATWQLIEVPQKILIPRSFPAVAPINDTEIAILGGYSYPCYLSDVVVLNTTTKQC